MGQLIQASSGYRQADREAQVREREPIGGTNPPAEQPRQDFDPRAFLKESVEAIWNQRMLGRIPDLYAPHATIHVGADGRLHGSEELLDRAVQWLAGFPDLRIFIDDVICMQRGVAYLTSVRRTAVGHNTRPSMFGAATGRRVVVSGIANARIEQGRYVEQWIELGDGDLVRQLGLDEPSVLQRLWPEPAVDEFDVTLGQGAVERPAGDRREGRSTEIGALIQACVETIWNRRQIGEIERFFAPSYRQRGPGSRALFGREELQTEAVSLLGVFPDLQMYIDDLFWESEPRDGARSSMRWTLLGTNTGPSAYGPPTNASLRLSGITNYRIEGGQMGEGWTAYSELGLARRLVSMASPSQTEEDG
jgi:predicted ester cyclase